MCQQKEKNYYVITLRPTAGSQTEYKKMHHMSKQ